MTYIYHITHIENLPGIISTNGLLCDARKEELPCVPINIAYENLKEKRARKPVPCGPQVHVADYVPFYFAPRSPMMYTISKGNIPGRRESDIVYLVSSVEWVNERGLEYAFCDGHPIIQITSFYDRLDDLDKIDWEVMRAAYWHDTTDDPDRSRRRQAEFLVHDFFPWDLVIGIAVRNKDIRGRVDECINGFEGQPKVAIKREWYYG